MAKNSETGVNASRGKQMTKPSDEPGVSRVSGKMLIFIWLSRFLALVACLSAIVFPIFHDATGLPVGSEYKDGTDRVFATADASLQTILFLSTLSFGMAAVAGFAIRNGIGSSILKRELNILCLSFLSYFLSRGVVYAYDALRAIAMQVDAGSLYLNVLDHLLEKQGAAVWFSAILSFTIFALNLNTDK